MTHIIFDNNTSIHITNNDIYIVQPDNNLYSFPDEFKKQLREIISNYKHICDAMYNYNNPKEITIADIWQD